MDCPASRDRTRTAISRWGPTRVVFFRFQKASCVVVGTFNIHILHPQWLARRGLIQQGLEIGVETNLTRPGIRLRFPEHGALWSISPDRLVIETDHAAFDCGQLAAHVLRAFGVIIHHDSDNA